MFIRNYRSVCYRDVLHHRYLAISGQGLKYNNFKHYEYQKGPVAGDTAVGPSGSCGLNSVLNLLRRIPRLVHINLKIRQTIRDAAARPKVDRLPKL